MKTRAQATKDPVTILRQTTGSDGQEILSRPLLVSRAWGEAGMADCVAIGAGGGAEGDELDVGVTLDWECPAVAKASPLNRLAGTQAPSCPWRTLSVGPSLPFFAISFISAAVNGPNSELPTLQNHSCAIAVHLFFQNEPDFAATSRPDLAIGPVSTHTQRPTHVPRLPSGNEPMPPASRRLLNRSPKDRA